jgi:hypothetical protein
MNLTQRLDDLGQSIWLDNITRNLLGWPHWQRLGTPVPGRSACCRRAVKLSNNPSGG